MTIELQDIPTLLSDLGGGMKLQKLVQGPTSICGCCGTIAEYDANTLHEDPVKPSAYSANGRMRISRWDKPVEFSPDMTEHLVIVDESMEFLIEWNDK